MSFLFLKWQASQWDHRHGYKHGCLLFQFFLIVRRVCNVLDGGAITTTSLIGGKIMFQMIFYYLEIFLCDVHIMFLMEIIFGILLWNTHYTSFQRLSREIQIWKLFYHSTIASHSWTFRKAKRHTLLLNLVNINYILESSKSKKTTTIFWKKKKIYILEYRYQV